MTQLCEKDSFQEIPRIIFLRWIGSSAYQVEIHGFMDPPTHYKRSWLLVYIRIITSAGNVLINFVALKTKVASLKAVFLSLNYVKQFC